MIEISEYQRSNGFELIIIGTAKCSYVIRNIFVYVDIIKIDLNLL